MRRPALRTGAAVLLALAIAGALLAGPLTQSEPRLAASNLWLQVTNVSSLQPGATICQAGEHIPTGRQELLLYVAVGSPMPNAGPIEVDVRKPHGRTLLRMRSNEQTRIGAVTFNLPPVNHSLANVWVCVRNRGPGSFALSGFPAREPASRDLRWRYAPPALTRSADGKRQVGPFKIDYAMAEPASPLQMASTVAKRAGYFKSAWIKNWALWGAFGLAIGVIGLSVAAVVAGRRRALALCAGVAVINAVAWAMLTPTLQTPDELPHIGHAQYLAETGKRPADAFMWESAEDLSLVEYGAPWGFETDPFWIEGADRIVRQQLAQDPGSVNARGAGFTNNNPPLYYLYEVIPYRLGLGGTLLDRILLMRLSTALLAGFLALFVFLFIREVMPSRPASAAVGALAVGLHPLTGHISGGVSPDTMLWAVSAAIFWLVARTFRRGLTVRRAVAIGALGFVATTVKPAGFMLVPGVVVGLAALVMRRPRDDRRYAVLAAGACGASAIGLLVGWHLLDQWIFGRGTVAGAGFASTEVRGMSVSVREFASYMWQFWIPRPLGFMTDQFVEWPFFPSRDLFFYGFVGRFGWFQYDFGPRTEFIAAVTLALLVVAAAASVLRDRAVLRGRWGEAITYLSLLGGVILLVNAAGYRYRLDTGHSFEQTRYLFPALLPIWGLTVALAVSLVRGMWRVPVAAFIITLLAAHNLAAHLLTAQRYYL